MEDLQILHYREINLELVYKLSVPVVGEQKLPKRDDPVLMMALIFTFFTL